MAAISVTCLLTACWMRAMRVDLFTASSPPVRAAPPVPPQVPPNAPHPLPASAAFNCSHVLSENLHDSFPIRTPLAVMTHVAHLATGKTFVEIGSRHGDLIECVSHVTRSAVSVEADARYCAALRQRARASAGRWASVCAFFGVALRPVPRAQLYFAWVQHYMDVGLLASIHSLQAQGHVPIDAETALVFTAHSHSHSLGRGENECFVGLAGKAPPSGGLREFAHRYVDVSFRENGQHGSMHVAVFRTAQLNMTAVDRAGQEAWCHRGSALQHPIWGQRSDPA